MEVGLPRGARQWKAEGISSGRRNQLRQKPEWKRVMGTAGLWAAVERRVRMKWSGEYRARRPVGLESWGT